jgi:hypothetical protein
MVGRFWNRGITLATSLLLCLGTTAGIGIQAAHATTVHPSTGVTGICISGVNDCLRTNGTPIDLWARDISGDPNQQWDVGYLGPLDEESSVCGTTGSWAGPYENTGAYAFFQLDESSAVGEQGNNVQWGGSTPYCWIWTNSGELINVAASNYWNSPQCMVAVLLYNQEKLANDDCTAWTQVTVG